MSDSVPLQSPGSSPESATLASRMTTTTSTHSTNSAHLADSRYAWMRLFAVLLMVFFTYAMAWVGVFLGLVAPTVETVQQLGFLIIFPLTFLSNAFVPTATLPDVLQPIAEWNPISALTQATRQLFGPTRTRSWAFYIWVLVVLTVGVVAVLLGWHAHGGAPDPTDPANQMSRTSAMINSAVLVFREGMLLAGVGLVLGLASSLGVTRLFVDLLYGVRPSDGLTIGIALSLLAAVAALACYVPARRATRIPPIIALRAE